MRHFRFTMTPGEGSLSRVDRRLLEAPGVTPEAILHLDLLGDGTAMAVYLLSGEPATADEALSAVEDVHSHHLFNRDGDDFHAHVHFDPGDPLRPLLELAERHTIVVEPPVEFVGKGGYRVDIGGRQSRVQRAAEEFPDGVDVTVEQIGEYDPSRNSLLTSLTERQREVLEVAVEEGYYAIPRRATHDDLAAVLDCSAGTVGEHLRKIEARVLSALLGE